MRPQRSERGPRVQILVALWGAGMVLFNFPMLIVFGGDATVLGLPLLPVALFAIWAGLIAGLAWALERGGTPPGAAATPPEPESPAPPGPGAP